MDSQPCGGGGRSLQNFSASGVLGRCNEASSVKSFHLFLFLLRCLSTDTTDFLQVLLVDVSKG